MGKKENELEQLKQQRNELIASIGWGFNIPRLRMTCEQITKISERIRELENEQNDNKSR